jgi:hypothetical protein
MGVMGAMGVMGLMSPRILIAPITLMAPITPIAFSSLKAATRLSYLSKRLRLFTN